MSKLCHCGLPLHYTDPEVQQQVEALIQISGEFIDVSVNGETWRVSRHYIALHGLKGADVSKLGFQRVN
jgi:hypothetical protein